MPRQIAEDHKEFRGILAGAAGKALKDALASGKIFQGRSTSSGKIPITIPRVPTPNFTWNGSQYAQEVEQEVERQAQERFKKKPKLWRSIEEPFEPGW